MVCSRWAIVRIVHLEKVSRIVCWIRRSVSRSTLAVASSRHRILASLRMARVRHSSCRWPTLKLPPPSATGASSFMGSSAMRSCMLLCFSALQIIASVNWSKGSRLDRMVPWNSSGSCGMMVSFDRTSSSRRRWMSTPSIRICPASASTRRNSARSVVLFPEPVRPTSPTFVPPSAAKLTSFSTSGRCRWYRRSTPAKVTQPFCGQSPGGAGSRSVYSSMRSAGRSVVYSSTRSTPFICASTSAIWRMRNPSCEVKLTA
mmetsp:Transcript_22585/g.38586  ORF Transcript_22585/g.38586 Transcript_22585/m.38586 type:complete len:259 (-) Transcript_22585:1086-1862(-)